MFVIFRNNFFPYHVNSSNAHIFEIVHTDIYGPYSIPSIDCRNYFLTLVDDYIQLKKWNQKNAYVFSSLSLENKFSTSLKCLSDNGPEFLIHSLFQTKGILHQSSSVQFPQQNVLVERKHQHILNVTHALFFQASLPRICWHSSKQHSVHLINKIHSPLLIFFPYFHLLYNKPHTLLHLKTFGCLAYASNLLVNRTKFDPHARKTIF